MEQPNVIPTLTILVPTVGRPTLAQCLNSIARAELRDDDCVLVASDANHQFAWQVFTAVNLPGRHIEMKSGPHPWGHAIRDALTPTLTTDFVLHLDDDDILLPGAVAMIREALATAVDGLHFFPFVSMPMRAMVGRKTRTHGRYLLGAVGTPSMVHPPEIELGLWRPYYGGDGDGAHTVSVGGGVAPHPRQTSDGGANPLRVGKAEGS